MRLPASHSQVSSSDDWLARSAATAAGKLLNSIRASAIDAALLGRNADLASHLLIASILHAHRPDDPIRSEEAVNFSDGSRRAWIVDPLDGTREFSDRFRTRTDWAVHVALVKDGRPAASAVAIPALQRVYTSGAPAPIPGRQGRLRIAVSRSRPPAYAKAVAHAIGGELWPMGSAGAKTAAILEGHVDAYLHDGGQYEWDSCAPVGVALAHGLHASRIDGSTCIYNRPDPSMPDLLICRTDLADAMLAAIANARTPALQEMPA
jgi:3'(2'), 5'-bisphosphate nucleotidase